MSILYIDFDLRFQKIVSELLISDNHIITCVQSASEGLLMMVTHHYDLVLVSLENSDMNILELIGTIKNKYKNMKIIVFGEEDNEDSELQCLDLGVFDYFRKPIKLPIFLKKIAMLASQFNNDTTLFSHKENIRIDLNKRIAFKDESPCNLTHLEYELLVYFLNHRNTTLTREQIYKDVWRCPFISGDLRTVDTHVKKLRSKLSINNIFSIRGVGYEWFESKKA